MAVILKFLDANNNEIDLSSGLDFGTSRKGIANINKFKVKNEGDATARDLILTSSTLNEKSEVDEEEYNRQSRASMWKTFGYAENGTFVKELRLGDIKPNKFAEGTKSTDILYTNETNCQFQDVWTAGVTEFKSDQHIFKKLDDGSKGQVAKRMSMPSLPLCRDFEVEFNIDFNCTVEGQESSLPFIGFPIRINSKGDGMGYMFLMQYRRTDKKFMVSIYKDAKGMTTNTDRDYGTKIFDTIVYQQFDKTKKIGFKIYNNTLGQPTFEVKYDRKNVKLGKAYVSGIQGYALSDTSVNAYVESGNFFKDISLYDGDYYCAMS
ncbi:MAG: hypothetical protein RR128_06330, partial [Clostridium sp.]